MKKSFWFSLMFLLSLISIPSMSFAQQIYTVQPGDTLWKIAVRYQVGISEIISANPQFRNPNLIYPGDKVNIPSFDATKSIESQVVQLTNQERAKHGLKALTQDWELSRVARYKSMDMRDKNYFSHTSPTYHDEELRNFLPGSSRKYCSWTNNTSRSGSGLDEQPRSSSKYTKWKLYVYRCWICERRITKTLLDTNVYLKVNKKGSVPMGLTLSTS
jgi:spore coat assembly protein SafA